MSTATTSRGSAMPGSVRVIGRRQIELYSRLIHTVDHVEGELRPEFDALDGFLSHAWAVTVTGAPKLWAIRFIEEQERSSRRWYGGAIGRVTFDGNMNTGLTLRTIRMKDGVGEVRAGATLLLRQRPAGRRGRMPAQGLGAVRRDPRQAAPRRLVRAGARPQPGDGRRVLLVDHEDLFVHTLANYIRTTGAEVATMRPDLARAELRAGCDARSRACCRRGPGGPADFAHGRDPRSRWSGARCRCLASASACKASSSISAARSTCSDTPMHGKPSVVRVLGGRLLRGLPAEFTVGRYHSLHAPRAALCRRRSRSPPRPRTASSWRSSTALPIAAVQFHPEFGDDLAPGDRHADHRRGAILYAAENLAGGSSLAPRITMLAEALFTRRAVVCATFRNTPRHFSHSNAIPDPARQMVQFPHDWPNPNRERGPRSYRYRCIPSLIPPVGDVPVFRHQGVPIYLPFHSISWGGINQTECVPVLKICRAVLDARSQARSAPTDEDIGKELLVGTGPVRADANSKSISFWTYRPCTRHRRTPRLTHLLA